MVRMIVVILLLSALCINAQKYYYTNGEKVNIDLLADSYTIILNETTSKIEVDKMLSNCGLKANIDNDSVKYITLKSLNINKDEVKNRVKNSYLGEKYKGIANVYINTKERNEISITDRIIVKIKDKSSESDLDYILKIYHLKLIKEEWTRYLGNNVYLLQVSEMDSELTLQIANTIYETGLVEYSHPDFLEKSGTEATPSDEYFSYQWNLNKIMATSAWDISVGNPSIIIAIIDHGVESNHPDLSNNMVQGWNVLANNNNTEPGLTNYFHGTACAGLASATTNNNQIGIAAVGYNCKIMPIKITENNDYRTTSSVISGINWAVLHGAHIINMSFYTNQTDACESAITNASTNGRNGNGCIITKSSGNNNSTNITYPGKHPKVICIGSTNQSDSRISGDYGSSYGSELDVMAPSGVYTTTTKGTGNISGDYLSNFSGTSASAPQVAGLAGLILSVDNSLSAELVRNILCYTAEDINLQGFDNETGWGRINAFGAVKSAARQFTNSGNIHIVNEYWWGNNSLSGNIIINNGRRLVIGSSAILNTNNFAIVSNNGTIIVENGATIHGFPILEGNTIKAIYSSLQDAINAATMGQVISIPLGNHSINYDLFIPFGKGLKVEPGANISFGAGNQLIVEGSLYADNAKFFAENGKYWKGIKLLNSTSGTYIKGCQISNYGSSYGADGIYIEDCSPLIQGNIIGNGQYNGIKIYGGNPTIDNNTIEYCWNGNGITVENYSSPIISNNRIRNTYYHGISIYAAGNVSIFNNSFNNCGFITHSYTGIRSYDTRNILAYINTISNCYYGIYSESFSEIDFGSSYGANAIMNNNKIQNCSFGLVAYDHSSIIAGLELVEGGYAACYNTIADISNYALYASNFSSIDAQMNYFSPNQQIPKIYQEGNSLIKWEPQWDGGFNMNKLALLEKPLLADEANIIALSLSMIRQKKYLEAKKILKIIIDKGSIKALNPLLKLFDKSQDSEIPAYLENLSSKDKHGNSCNHYKESLCKIYYSLGEYSKALRITDELLLEGNKKANVDKFMIYALGLRDNIKAISILKEIEQEMSKDMAEELYTLLLPEEGKLYIPAQTIKSYQSKQNVIKPMEFSISQNFPNPFNPTTKISYNIANLGIVDLRIYDMLGREVAVLVNEIQPAGQYEVVYNSHNLPSGFYLYKIKVDEYSETRKMILLK